MILGLGRSPGEGNGNSLQDSCLGNHMDRGAWWATVPRVTRVRHDLATKLPTYKKQSYMKFLFLVVTWLRSKTRILLFMEFFFIHSLSKYLLNVYSVPDAILGSGNTLFKLSETCPIEIYQNNSFFQPLGQTVFYGKEKLIYTRKSQWNVAEKKLNSNFWISANVFF